MVAKNMKQYVYSLFTRHYNLFKKFRAIDLMKVLEYRSSFIFWVVVSILWTCFNLVFFSILTNVSGSIGGWNTQEVFVLLGVFTIIDAFTWSMFYANMSEYASDIFDGRLSLLLCRPVNTQFYLMTRRLNPQIIFRLILGIVIVIVNLRELQLVPSIWQWLLFCIFLTISVVFLYFFWFILTTGAFFFERLENINEVIPSFRRVWQVPNSVFHGVLSVSLTTIIPFLLITTLPSEILLNRVNIVSALVFLLITLLFAYISHVFLRFAIRHYSGAAN